MPAYQEENKTDWIKFSNCLITNQLTDIRLSSRLDENFLIVDKTVECYYFLGNNYFIDLQSDGCMLYFCEGGILILEHDQCSLS